MSPISTSGNIGNTRLIDAEPFRNNALENSLSEKAAYFTNRRFVQDSKTVITSFFEFASRSSLLIAIIIIVRIRSDEQVIGSYAGRIVAAMKDAGLIGRYLSTVN